VTGPIVAFGEVYKNYTLFHIDDGSGQNIAVKVQRLLSEEITPESPSNTTVSNVNISTTVGASDIRIDGIQLDIGTVVKLKCTIERFWDKSQLVLQRAVLLKSTTEEAKEWEQQAKWITRLKEPWSLDSDKIAHLGQKLEEERSRGEERAKKKEKYLKMKETMNLERNRKYEMKRKRLEDAMNQGALI
jgi:hypothetical protein